MAGRGENRGSPKGAEAAERSGGVTFGQVRRSHSLVRWGEARMTKERKIILLMGQRNGYL